MQPVDRIADLIRERAANAPRFFVAIAGPPGAGKSTVSTALASCLSPEGSAVVQADGFHYDNQLLDQIGRRHRKGAEDTFDCRGLEILLQRLRSDEEVVAVPIFDRSLDVSRAAATLIGPSVKYIVVEGNYLLLDKKPWSSLSGHFDFTIMIRVPRQELERRLVDRWLGHGLSGGDARNWVDSNDLPNVDVVANCSRDADFVWLQDEQTM